LKNKLIKLKKPITNYKRKYKKFYIFLKHIKKHKKLLHRYKKLTDNQKKQLKNNELKNKIINLIAYCNYTQKNKKFYIFLKRIKKYKKLLHRYKKLTNNKNDEKKQKKKLKNKLIKLKKLITNYKRNYKKKNKKTNKKFYIFSSLKVKEDKRLQDKNLSNKKRKYYMHIHKCKQKDLTNKTFFTLCKSSKKIKKSKLKLRRQRLILVYTKKIKEHSNLKKFKNKKNLKANSFGNHFIESLRKFVGKEYSIYAMLKNLKIKSIKNKNIKKRRQFIKKKLNILLYKYKKTQFFEIGKQIAYITSKKKNSAQFLADFISSQLSKRSLKRRHYFFLKFIRTVLNLLVKKSVKSKIIGIKAVIRGRLNKARRSNRRAFKISIGRISLHKINLDINHAKAIAYTVDGTFGVEVCINHRKSFKIKKPKLKKLKLVCFYNQKKQNNLKKHEKEKYVTLLLNLIL
jgi:ribosomal protein S3